MAAILNAAVMVRKLVFQRQTEVPDLSAPPDQERVTLRRFFGRRLTRDRSVFDRPELRIAIPAVQGFSIEEVAWLRRLKNRCARADRHQATHQCDRHENAQQIGESSRCKLLWANWIRVSERPQGNVAHILRPSITPFRVKARLKVRRKILSLDHQRSLCGETSERINRCRAYAGILVKPVVLAERRPWLVQYAQGDMLNDRLQA